MSGGENSTQMCWRCFERHIEQLNLELPKLFEEQVEWIVNDISELGIKVGNQFFFLYKGRSLENSRGKYRFVGKREFGECCHPWDSIKEHSGEARLPKTYVNFYSNTEEWFDIPDYIKDDE